uniref:Apple domain-containing protein n=1 Tax=Panagrolaimus sp. ES5 TaxID=591445 RepID=A0AC34G797_9BILA
MKTGRHLIILSSIFVLLLTTFPCFIEAVVYKKDVMCQKFKTSTTVIEFKQTIQNWANKGPDLLSSTSMITDDSSIIKCYKACTAWLCVANDLVNYGGGCYSDYKAICTNSTEQTYGDADQFNELKQERRNFVYIYKEKRRPLQADNNLRKAVGEIFFYTRDIAQKDYFVNEFLGVALNTATPPTSTTPNIDTSTSNDNRDPKSNGFMIQFNRFKLFGMILLGLIFAQF